jgi:hypothetical protein
MGFKILNDGDVFCLPYYRHLISIKIALAIVCLVTLTATFAQDAKSYYEKGLASVREGEYEEAIKLF